jgi:hypothetical protein
MDVNTKDKFKVLSLRYNLQNRLLEDSNATVSSTIENVTLLANSNKISNFTLQIVFDPNESHNTNLGLMISLGVLLLILLLTIIYVVFRLKLKRNKERDKHRNSRIGLSKASIVEKMQDNQSIKIPIARFNSEGLSAKSKLDFDISSTKLINIQNGKKTAQEENKHIDFDGLDSLALPKILLQRIHKEAIQYVVKENILPKKKNFNHSIKNIILKDKSVKKFNLKDLRDRRYRIKKFKENKNEIKG